MDGKQPLGPPPPYQGDANAPPGQYPPPQGGYPPPPQGAYPQQPQYPPSQGQYPPPQQNYNSATTTTIVTQPAVMSNAVLRFSEYPMQILCPHCQAQIVTSCEYISGTFTWLMALLICCVGGSLGCCLIPFCVDGMKDVNHTCPNCHKLVGCYRRM